MLCKIIDQGTKLCFVDGVNDRYASVQHVGESAEDVAR